MTSPTSKIDICGNELGGPLVEAALIMPVLLVLLFGALDVAMYSWQRNRAYEAAQMGARLLVTSSPVGIGDGLPDASGAPIPSWDATKLGKPCLAADGTNICPMPGGVGGVSCTYVSSTSCTSGYAADNTQFTALATRLGLNPKDIRVEYRANSTGFVGRPGAVGVNVTVTVCQPYRSFLMKALGGWTYTAQTCAGYPNSSDPKVAASATLPSEDMAGAI